MKYSSPRALSIIIMTKPLLLGYKMYDWYEMVNLANPNRGCNHFTCIFLELIWITCSLSKRQFLCALIGHIGPPPPLSQLCWLLSFRMFACFEHGVWYVLNTCAIGVCLFLDIHLLHMNPSTPFPLHWCMSGFVLIHTRIWWVIRRVSFHVGRSRTRFYIIVVLEVSHVYKHKLTTNHILGAYWNVEGCGHMLLDFHAPTKTLLNLTSTGSKNGFRRRRRRRRLIGGLIFEKMRVASWHIPHQIPSTFEQICLYTQ